MIPLRAFACTIALLTGTRTGEGEGGAVRAATSAGDSMREPAHHAPAATAAMIAKEA